LERRHRRVLRLLHGLPTALQGLLPHSVRGLHDDVNHPVPFAGHRRVRGRGHVVLLPVQPGAQVSRADRAVRTHAGRMVGRPRRMDGRRGDRDGGVPAAAARRAHRTAAAVRSGFRPGAVGRVHHELCPRLDGHVPVRRARGGDR